MDHKTIAKVLTSEQLEQSLETFQEEIENPVNQPEDKEVATEIIAAYSKELANRRQL